MEQHTQRRRATGRVVSAKMQKTVVVQIDHVRVHPKYHKRFTVSRRFKAHDEKGTSTVGDAVIIEETRPISRDKRWRVVGKKNGK